MTRAETPSTTRSPWLSHTHYPIDYNSPSHCNLWKTTNKPHQTSTFCFHSSSETKYTLCTNMHHDARFDIHMCPNHISELLICISTHLSEFLHTSQFPMIRRPVPLKWDVVHGQLWTLWYSNKLRSSPRFLPQILIVFALFSLVSSQMSGGVCLPHNALAIYQSCTRKKPISLGTDISQSPDFPADGPLLLSSSVSVQTASTVDIFASLKGREKERKKVCC